MLEFNMNICFLCPASQEAYQDDTRIWNAIFELVVSDLAHCEREGVDLGGEQGTVYPIVLGNKGDWSYLEPW
jgi:hypothetical protein